MVSQVASQVYFLLPHVAKILYCLSVDFCLFVFLCVNNSNFRLWISLQCAEWLDDAKLNMIRQMKIEFSKLHLRDNDIYFIPRKIVHQFKTVSATLSIGKEYSIYLPLFSGFFPHYSGIFPCPKFKEILQPYFLIVTLLRNFYIYKVSDIISSFQNFKSK